MPKAGSVIRNATMATAQVIVTGAVLFVLYRYLLDTLGAEQVGIWTIVLAMTTTSRVSELGLAGGVIKFVAAANAKEDSGRASDLVQTAFLTIAAVLALVLTAGFPFITWLLALIVPANSLPDAMAVLPYALVSVWLSGAGGVAHASLDGCQRADLRAAVAMVAAAVFLLLVWALTPTYSLAGLAMAQVCQAVFVMVTSWALLRRQIFALPLLPVRWRLDIFREMFRYGVNFQIISIFAMLYAPLTKAFVTTFGGLSTTAYFEMADRMVLQFRALVVAANQVLVPKIAALHETEPGGGQQIYHDSYRVVFFLAVPLYAVLIAAVPFIGQIWIGHGESDFVFFGVIIAVGYLINTLSAPAYFLNLGTGSLRWNVLSHLVLGVLTAALGYTLGKLLEARGAVIGSVTALMVASAIIVWNFHRERSIPFMDLLPNESRRLLAVSGLAAAAGWFVSESTDGQSSMLLGSVAGMLVTGLVVTAVVWRHPVRAAMWTRTTRDLRRGS